MTEAGKREFCDNVAYNLRKIAFRRNDSNDITDFNLNENENLILYPGTIKKIEQMKRGWISHDSTPYGEIYFEYEDHFRFKTGDKVYFNIGYNLRGAIAINITSVFLITDEKLVDLKQESIMTSFNVTVTRRNDKTVDKEIPFVFNSPVVNFGKMKLQKDGKKITTEVKKKKQEYKGENAKNYFDEL